MQHYNELQPELDATKAKAIAKELAEALEAVTFSYADFLETEGFKRDDSSAIRQADAALAKYRSQAEAK